MNLREFADPPKEYRPTPFWSWNGTIEPAEIETQLRNLGKKGIGGVILHASPGLLTGYLGDDWLSMVRKAFDIARDLKIEMWLHDEDRAPSGSAGGQVETGASVPAASRLVWDPDAACVTPARLDTALAFVRRTADGLDIVDGRPASLEGMGVFYTAGTGRDVRFNNHAYPDLMDPASAEAFLAATHETYREKFKYDFGTYLPGIITDAPTVALTVSSLAEGSLSWPWSDGFPEFFAQRFGYSIFDRLHHLLDNGDDGFAVRHDFWTAVQERFRETFLDTLYRWCDGNNLALCGRLPHEESIAGMIAGGGAVTALYESLHIPMVTMAGTGSMQVRSARQAAGAASQFGRGRAVGAMFGAAGQDITFEEMKRRADVATALGIGRFAPEQTSYSLLGERKLDGPSFSYHQPSWERFDVINDYLARCSWVAAQGKGAAKVLLLAPASGSYGLFDPSAADGGDALRAVEGSYDELARELVAEHVAFDIGDETVLRHHGAASDGGITVGNARYGCVVLPPSPSWRSSTLDLLETADIPVVLQGGIPGRIDGRSDGRMALFTGRDPVTMTGTAGETIAAAIAAVPRMVSVTGPDGSEARDVLVNHRIDNAAHLIFLANTDASAGKQVTVTVGALGGVTELDPATGMAYRYGARIKDGATVIEASLLPAGSKAFLIDQTQTFITGSPASPTESSLTIKGPYSCKPLNDNVLVLDRCMLEMDDEVLLENGSVWEAKKLIWQRTGLTEFAGIQPWVLKERNVRSRTNETKLTWQFDIREMPSSIALAMEHSDRFTVEINGHHIDFTPGRWFIDRRMRTLHLEDHLTTGTNTITARTDYLWDTEIAPVYIFGPFGVGTAEEGYPIIAAPETLAIGDWGTQGFPFYPGSMQYRIGFTITPSPDVRYEIDLSGARGTVFSVAVNGEAVGTIPFAPYRGDITGALKAGDNVVEIDVAGSIRNVFHPHAADDRNGAGPYECTPYGFMTPPKLIKIAR